MCKSGYECSEEDLCVVSDEPDVQGVMDERTSIPSDAIFGDLNYDGHKDILDYSILLDAIMKWERSGVYTEKADLDRDQKVTMRDFYLFRQILYE